MEELDLKDLFTVFWKRKLQILLIILIFVVIGITYSYFGVEPIYKASTTLLLTPRAENTEDGGISTEDITLNTKLVSTYEEIIKTDNVLSEVVKNINNSNITIGDIKGNITVEVVEDTGVLKITVTNNNPNNAATIANETAKVFCEKVVEIYDMSNTLVMDRAEPTNVPDNINHPKDIIIFTFIGVVVAVMFVLIEVFKPNNKKGE